MNQLLELLARLVPLLDKLMPLLEQALPFAEQDLERYLDRKRNPAPPPPGEDPAPPPPGDTPAPPPPTGRHDYATLRKPEFLYKTRLDPRPVSRHDVAVLVPKDRPKIVRWSFTGAALTMRENYLASPTTEDRWIGRFSGSLKNNPGTVTAHYADGGSETFQVKSMSGQPRTQFKPGPYRPGAAPPPPPPPPSEPTPEEPGAEVFAVLAFDGTRLTVSPALGRELIRVKFIYDDSDNDGRPFINFTPNADRTVWTAQSTLPMSGRHGFLFNSKIGRVRFPVRWDIPGITRTNQKPEAHPTYGDTWGAYFRY